MARRCGNSDSAPACDSDETRLGQLEEVLARGRTRDPGEIGKLAAGQGLPTHQGGKDGCARGIADERRNLDQICRRDHARILPLGPEAKQETRLRRAPNRSLATAGGLAAKVTHTSEAHHEAPGHSR